MCRGFVQPLQEPDLAGREQLGKGMRAVPQRHADRHGGMEVEPGYDAVRRDP